MAALPSASNAAPTSNFQGDAGQNIDATKFAALQSIAQSGSQAQSGLALAGQQQVAARTQALKDAMAFSAARGGSFNPAVQQNTQAQVAAPFDSRIAAEKMTANNFAQDNAATNNAYGGYFNLAKAGLPVANAALQGTIANDKLAAQSKALTEQVAMLRAQAELAKLQPGAGMAPKDAISALGGSSNAGNTILNATAAGAAAGVRNKANGIPNGGAEGDTTTQATQALGPSLSQTLISKAQQGIQAQIDKQQAATATHARSDPNYVAGYPHILAAISGGQDPTALLNNMLKQGVDLNTARQIIADAQAAASKARSYSNAAPTPTTP